MSTSSTVTDQDVAAFFQASLRALVRAERQGRTPVRFTEGGQAVWQAFHNELTVADLAALAIADAGASMPLPFDPAQWWPGWPDWALLASEPGQVEGWLDEALTNADATPAAFLRQQAALLNLSLPADEALAALPTPAAHERWLELPGTAGWVAFHLCTRPDAALYFWENFTVVCASPQEMLLAGLIAWELGAPPQTALPIRLDSADLAGILDSKETYHAVAGRRDLHGRHDLRFLQRELHPPFWL